MFRIPSIPAIVLCLFASPIVFAAKPNPNSNTTATGTHVSKDTIEQDSFGFGQSRNGTSGSTIGGRASSGSSVTQTLEGKKSLSALAAYNGKILTASTTALKPQQKHSK